MNLSGDDMYYLLELLDEKIKRVNKAYDHDNEVVMSYTDRDMIYYGKQQLEKYQDELRILQDLQFKVSNLENEIDKLKSYTELDRVVVYDNGIAELHFKDNDTMLINRVVYSDVYLTGWEDEDCFIKR